MTLPLTFSVRGGFRSIVAFLLTAGPAFALQLTMDMNKRVYYPGERMEITVTAHNPGPVDLTLSFGSSCQMYYRIDTFEAPEICLTIVTSATVPAHGSHTWRMEHSWSAYNPGPGVHTLTAGLLGYGSGGMIAFEVAVPPVPLELSLALSKERLQVGERMELSLTARNPASTDVTLYFSSSCQMYYALDAYQPPEACLMVLTQVTIPAFGSHTWRRTHSWSAYNPGPGTHVLSGGLHGYGEAVPITFEVLPTERPAGNFLVDFDHLPGTDNALGDIQGLLACGLAFRSIDGDPPGVGSYAGNQLLTCGRCTYPTGFNIVIEFDPPVYGITADVGSCPTCHVTMIVRGEDGAELARAEAASGPYLQFAATVTVRSRSPIASAEFWPSQTNAAVHVDNCFLYLTPVRADFNADGEVGGLDLEHFQNCHSGPGIEQPARECLDARLDDDSDVDQSDFAILQRCLGADALVAPDCLN